MALKRGEKQRVNSPLFFFGKKFCTALFFCRFAVPFGRVLITVGTTRRGGSLKRKVYASLAQLVERLTCNQ
jgi:hypothetical protein